jgi:hypothetical protein
MLVLMTAMLDSPSGFLLHPAYFLGKIPVML